MPHQSMQTLQFDNAQFLPHVCDLIDEGHTVSIRAKGNSMRPFMESERDIAVLSKATDIEKGDVVLAEIEQGHFVLHRIDAIMGPKVRLRGDGNPYQTEMCLLTDIRAKAIRIVRKGKTYDLNGHTWRIYSFFWTNLRSIRRWLLALYRWLWLGQVPHRLKK